MLNNSTELNKLKSSILYYIAQDNEQLSNLLLKAEISSEIIGYDNWNGGIDIYQLNFTIPIELYKQTRNLHCVKIFITILFHSRIRTKRQ